MNGDTSHRIELSCKKIDFHRDKGNRNRLEVDYNVNWMNNGNIIFAYYVPMIFSELLGHFFIFFHLICSGLLLGGAIMVK